MPASRGSSSRVATSALSPPSTAPAGRMPVSSRTACSTAAPTRPSAWLARRRAKRCWLQPPAAVRDCTYRLPTLWAVSRSPEATPTAYPPRRTSTTASGSWSKRATPTTRWGPSGLLAENRSSQPSRRAGATSTTRWVTRVCGSDVEAEGAQLLAAVVGDLVRTPRRHPDPVDPVGRDQALEGLLGLVLDDVGERAGRRGERHVADGVVLAVDGDAVDEAEVDDVDAELGVDDVAQRLLDVGHVGWGGGLGHLKLLQPGAGHR